MKRLFTLIILSFVYTTSVTAQNKATISARYGINTKAISTTFHFAGGSAIEGLASISHNNNRVLLTALYEEFFQLGANENLKLFAGAGMHAGFHREKVTVYSQELKFGEVLVNQERDAVKRNFVTGADAILGLNYYFPSSPFMIGVDLKPSVDFVNGHDMLVDGGLRLGIAL